MEHQFVDNGTGLVSLVVTSAGGGLIWYGSTTSGVWDVATSPNWSALPAAVAAFFSQYDAVRFDDTATNFVVRPFQTVSPSAVTISNQVNPYLLTGAFGISGSASLIK